MQTLPGFRDFLPEDWAKRNYIFARWREVTRRYGFVEWEGPLLEPTELYKKKSGAEIVDQLFNFTDKGEREVALRPELTPTLARLVAAHEREFWTDFLRGRDVPPDRWDEFLQAIDKFGREPRENTAEKLGKLADPVFATLKSAGNSEKLGKLVDALDGRGLADFVAIDIGIVRGLAYYTGIVFEVFDRAGKFRAIAGGGRYDNLIAQLSDGAVSMPALGFAMGDVVLGELINEIPRPRAAMQKAITSRSKIDIYVVIAKEERRGDALTQIQQLLDRGYRVDYPLTPTKVARQFQAAEDAGAALAVLYGDEWPQVKIKNMATAEQELVPSEKLLDRLAQLL